MTQEEADAANLLYPVPPYGQTYLDPGNSPYDPPPAPLVKFVKMTNVRSVGTTTVVTVRQQDLAVLAPNVIMTMWPIECVFGIADDVGTRPTRVLSLSGQDATLNYDSSGLDLTGMVLIGVVYVGP
jgi:hypothetical protein